MSTVAKFLISSLLLTSAPSAFALDEIIHPYQSVRSAGMGGVLYTTGLYEENFFGNPARVNANPKVRITVLDPTLEINSQIPSTVGDLTGSGDVAQKISSSAGNNNHGRFEMTAPSVFIPPDGDFKWGFAAGLLTSIDANIDVRQNYTINPQLIFDIGPAVTIGRKLLDQDALSVGATLHAMYRAAPNDNYSLADVLRGSNFISISDAANGSMVDFDIGATYRLPWKLGETDLLVGAAINDMLDGGFSNLSFHPIDSGTYPMAQPRTFNFGISATRAELPPFKDIVVAVEMSDIGNNPSGSYFRLLHVGGEGHFGILTGRVGLNQGYLCAGLGLDLRFFTLDAATYGEEMTLNPGGMEDRRFAIRIAFQI